MLGTKKKKKKDMMYAPL